MDVLSWYAREWHLPPQMPNQAMWDSAMEQMHARARQQFGEEAAKAAWMQFQKNKGWTAQEPQA